VIPEYQLIEKMKNIFKRNIFGFVRFRSGLNITLKRKWYYINVENII